MARRGANRRAENSLAGKIESAPHSIPPHIGRMEYRENYWGSAPQKAEFLRFLAEIHNLDLSAWDRLGYWDPLYRPFSFFDGDTLAANVCLYSMDMVVAGQRTRVAQISGVGTRPDYRRRGLGHELTQKAIEWATPDHDFFYLFADEEAVPLYEKFGFSRVTEHRTRIELRGTDPKPGAVKLDMDKQHDRDRAFRLAFERTVVSNRLGVLNPRLFMFWCLYGFPEHVYHLRDLDLIVICEREGTTVRLHDIVGASMPPFSDIYPLLANRDDRYAEFSFLTDKLALDNHELIETTENDTFVRGDFPLIDTPFIFPLTAQA